MSRLALPIVCLSAILSSLHVLGSEPRQLSFNRDVRPILVEHCSTCHGPDASQRKAKLRLDQRDDALADRPGGAAIVSGDPEASLLIERITTEASADRMPPREFGKPLSSSQINTLRQWIAQGARYERHWSLDPPRRPAAPMVSDSSRVANPIDAFIAAGLAREGLTAQPEADRACLARRVTLDLTGLPPTSEEVERFLSDQAPGAYERLVDRLLASPRFGEHQAARWLDAARYADTNGYQTDAERIMWRWRDWVIDSINTNRPFDQFTIEQLAGDLLPNPTLEQKIATGFHRNHRGNAEGGIIPEEFAVEYVVDRVDTTATVWLGLTLGCARCHDHKYDPITQKEYYQLFAIFNNVPERGKAIKYGNSPPWLVSPTRDQQAELDRLDGELIEKERRFNEASRELAAAQTAWEASSDAEHSRDDPVPEALTWRQGKSRDGERSGWTSPDFPVLDAKTGDFGFLDEFSIAAWVRPGSDRQGTIASKMLDEPRETGYSVALRDGRVEVAFVKRWLDDALRVITVESLSPEAWHHVVVTYDGTRVADGVHVYLDGELAKLEVLLDELNQTFTTSEPFRIGAGHGPKGRFSGAIDDARLYRRALASREASLLAEPLTAGRIVEIPKAARTIRQQLVIDAVFLRHHAPKSIGSAWDALQQARERRKILTKTFPTTMVMSELPTPRATRVLRRGQYDQPGERVEPSLPKSLGVWPSELPRNRLGLAKWLVAPDNPLTARVFVNRQWQQYFGSGLIRTPEDFGSQGDWPSHPDLLDWLATEFVREGWDLKRLTRTIVTSATYMRSSRIKPEALALDPENRWLGRGPRFRLSAEMIRDQALAISGLLVEQLGGPSVKPYQPAGLWKDLGGTEYDQGNGRDLHRRSLYTFWKRTSSPPEMALFDAAGREACRVRLPRTNTPTQALTLLNDVTYLEAARALAQTLLDTTASGRLDHHLLIARGFQRAVGRPATQEELAVLARGYDDQYARFRQRPDDANALIRVGETPVRSHLDPLDLAALTVVMNTILNLDEVLTKE